MADAADAPPPPAPPAPPAPEASAAPPPPTAEELAELRKLTPEQEEANAAAAEHIGEVAARMEGVPEQEREPAMFVGTKTAWDYFEGGLVEAALSHTPLVDLEYLVELARRGGVMPAGLQRVPSAALITTANLWRLKLWGKKKHKASLGVLVWSYPWLDWFHPDRLGAQLRRLLPVLEAMLAEAKADSPHCTVGVMVDFLCLPQKPFASEEEGARFKHSLVNINLWYYHKYTYVLLVSTPPPEGAEYGNTRLHEARGWCVFEKGASMAVKVGYCLLDFAGYRGATEWGHSGSTGRGTCIGEMMAGRKAPISPAAFGESMRARVATGELKFTARADEEFVIGQYEKGFVGAIGREAAKEEYRVLVFNNLGWGEAEAAELLEALKYAAAHCSFPHGEVYVNCGWGNQFDLAALRDKASAEGLDGKFRI